MSPHTHRVLCVEDHSDSCDLIRFILNQDGFDVVTAADFDEGLFLASKEHFDLHLFDQCLPGGEGTELCQKIHATDPQVPVVIFSGDTRATTRQQALEAGAAAFLAKPIDPFLLSSVVKKNIEETEMRALDAKVAELLAIRDEIASRLDGMSLKLSQIKEVAGNAEKSFLKVKAFQAFAAAGGTKAAFERMWPDLWKDEFMKQGINFSG